MNDKYLSSFLTLINYGCNEKNKEKLIKIIDKKKNVDLIYRKLPILLNKTKDSTPEIILNEDEGCLFLCFESVYQDELSKNAVLDDLMNDCESWAVRHGIKYKIEYDFFKIYFDI